MMTMRLFLSHHENDRFPPLQSLAGFGVARRRRIGHHPSVDTKTRLVVAFVFLLAIALIVIAGLIAVASPAR
jgi:hypothetical protein